MTGALILLVVFLVVGHPAKEASTKHDQPFIPCELSELEQLHPFQVREGQGTDSTRQYLLQRGVLGRQASLVNM